MKKFKNKKGFTLAELLIVVAIVAVLVAISIPIFSGKLNKAKVATNQANVRAAKAAAVADYLTDGETGNAEYLYDVNAGTIEKKNAKSDVNDSMILQHIKVTVTVGADGATSVTTSPEMEEIGIGTSEKGVSGGITEKVNTSTK